MRQYAAALEADQQQRAQIGASLRSLPGSFSALCASYYASPEFRGLKASTQPSAATSSNASAPSMVIGCSRICKRMHVRNIIGAKASTPEAANNLLKVLRVVLNFAVARA